MLLIWLLHSYSCSPSDNIDILLLQLLYQVSWSIKWVLISICFIAAFMLVEVRCTIWFYALVLIASLMYVCFNWSIVASLSSGLDWVQVLLCKFYCTNSIVQVSSIKREFYCANSIMRVLSIVYKFHHANSILRVLSIVCKFYHANFIV